MDINDTIDRYLDALRINDADSLKYVLMNQISGPAGYVWSKESYIDSVIHTSGRIRVDRLVMEPRHITVTGLTATAEGNQVKDLTDEYGLRWREIERLTLHLEKAGINWYIKGVFHGPLSTHPI